LEQAGSALISACCVVLGVEARNSVAKMARCTSISPLGSEFDNFLFAPIGEDRNGMLLSVLSALARLDVDPWQEADDLARLPGETATQRLASLIAALPDGAHLDPGAVATRLIALLPRRASSDIPSREMLFGISAGPRGFIYAIVIFMTFVLGIQWMIASHQPPVQVDNTTGPPSSTFFPQMPPPTSAQDPR
jgi:hypothetical protein